MGSFSWLKADTLGKTANIREDEPYKLLIPKEFGGGSIKDHYRGYGQLGFNEESGFEQYDIFELLAFWNADEICQAPGEHQGKVIRSLLQYSGDVFPKMKEHDQFTVHNRSFGIYLDETKCRYPLKLVSASFKGTYEDCLGISIWDPNQGFARLPREKVPRVFWNSQRRDIAAYLAGQRREAARIAAMAK